MTQEQVDAISEILPHARFEKTRISDLPDYWGWFSVGSISMEEIVAIDGLSGIGVDHIDPSPNGSLIFVSLRVA